MYINDKKVKNFAKMLEIIPEKKLKYKHFKVDGDVVEINTPFSLGIYYPEFAKDGLGSIERFIETNRISIDFRNNQEWPIVRVWR